MAIGKIESVGRFFVGQADIVLFKKPSDLGAAKLSTLTDPKSLGNIHLDSTNYTGEDATVEEKKNEQGQTYYSAVIEGSEGFEFFVPSTSEDMLKALLDAQVISDTFTNSTAWAADSKVLGASGGHSMEAPIMLISEMGDQSMVYPNAKIVAKVAMEDKVTGIQVQVTAQHIDTANLKTVMFVDGKVQYEA